MERKNIEFISLKSSTFQELPHTSSQLFTEDNNSEE